MPGHEAIPLEGELNCWNGGFDLPDLLLSVCETGRTGLLRFTSAEGEKTVFVSKGEVVFASSSSEDDRLGEYLLRAGKISLGDLSKHTHMVRPGMRLGTLLVESGVLGPKELVQAVIGQVRAIVLSLFRWTEARYGFDEQELPSKETITLNMPTAQLIMDGIQMIDSWRRISQGVGSVDLVCRRVDGNEKMLRKLNLDTSVLEVLAILAQGKRVSEVCDSSPLPDIQVCRHLWAFRCLGWVEPGEAEQVASTPEEAVALDGEERPMAPASEPELDAPVSPEEVPAPVASPAAAEDLSFELVDPESSEPDGCTEETIALDANPFGPLEPAKAGVEEIAERQDVNPPMKEVPASTSPADLEETTFELVSGDSSEFLDVFESKEEPGEPEGIPVVDPDLVDPGAELSLEIPDADSSEALPLVEPQNGADTGAKESSPSDESAHDTEDGDLEGLGMVLGEEKQGQEAG
jgi:hypothetical protein